MKKALLSLFSILITLSASSQIPELWGSMALGGPFGIGGIIKINGDGTGYSMDHACTGLLNGGSIQSNLLPINSFMEILLAADSMPLVIFLVIIRALTITLHCIAWIRFLDIILVDPSSKQATTIVYLV